MGQLYRKRASNRNDDLHKLTNLMDSSLVTHQKQTAGVFRHAVGRSDFGNIGESSHGDEHVLLYDYIQDKIIEVSPLLLRLLQDLDGTATPSELVKHLAEEMEEIPDVEVNIEDLRTQIDFALRRLYQDHFLSVA